RAFCGGRAQGPPKRAGSSSTTSTACSTSSPARRGSATSSRTSGARRRAWSWTSESPRSPRPRAPERVGGAWAGQARRIYEELPSEGGLTVPRMGSFKRSLLGYRRPDVEAAMSARDTRIQQLESDLGRRSEALAGLEGEISSLSGMVIEREREI